jgi:dihydroorotate dehydrogenase (fumarate)
LTLLPDLSTAYLGMQLPNPFVPSASPLSRNLDTIRRMEDAGAAAVVLHSLFEEQIRFESQVLDRYMTVSAESFWEALSYYPEPEAFALPPDQYLEHVQRAKAAVSIPIIGSLNGVSAGGWIKYARMIQEAGADALELNVYFVPSDPRVVGAQIDQATIDLVREVRQNVQIPLAVKLSPFYSNVASIAQRLVEVGANGLVLFNRFNQPDIDLDTLEVVPRPMISRSGDGEALRLPLRWIAILRDQLPVDLAATGGVHSAHDALKLLMVGADITMMASELLLHGVDRLRDIRRDLEAWLVEREYDSVKQLQGSMSHRKVSDPSAFERAHYLRTVGTFSLASTMALDETASTYGFVPSMSVPSD